MARQYAKGRHCLANIDPVQRRATCSVCGDVLVSRKVVAGKNYWRCQEASNAQMRKWRKANPQARRRHATWSHLKSNYGLSPEQYGALFIEQNYQCGICCASLLDRKAVVDHDHTTGVIRGLLCNPCNGNEGWFRNHRDRIYAWQERVR